MTTQNHPVTTAGLEPARATHTFEKLRLNLIAFKPIVIQSVHVDELQNRDLSYKKEKDKTLRRL